MSILAIALSASPALGAGILGEPDVTMTCRLGEQLVAACAIGCASRLQASGLGYTPPGPKPSSPPPPPPPSDGSLSLSNLSRVEFYAGGKVGRADGRTWIAWERQIDINTAQRGVFYVGPGQLCGLDLALGSTAPTWRVDRFNQ